MEMEEISFLNTEVEFMTRANSMINPLDPKSGILLIGKQGIEFRAEKGLGYIQIPWQSITQIRVQMFFKGLYIRGFFIETDEDQLLDFVVSDAKKTLQVLKTHLKREQFVANPSNLRLLFKRKKK